MASLPNRLPAEDAAALYTAIDAAARQQQKANPEDKRTLDQLRADVLAGLGWSALRAGHLGCCQPDCGHVHQRLGTRRGGRAVTVNVTVAHTTLIGVDDHDVDPEIVGLLPNPHRHRRARIDQPIPRQPTPTHRRSDPGSRYWSVFRPSAAAGRRVRRGRT